MDFNISENAKKILMAIGLVSAGFVIGALLVKNYDKIVYKKLMESHDKNTAERLTQEFNKKIKELNDKFKKRNKESEEKARRQIIELCKRFNINPNEILRD